MKNRDQTILTYFFKKVFNLKMSENDLNNISSSEKQKIDEIVKNKYVITFGIVGNAGAGKTTTVQALFNINKPKNPNIDVQVYEKSLEGKGTIRFYDFPGFGESIERRDFIKSRYDELLPQCDVILWVFEAKSRIVELDEMYLRNLSPELKKKIVVGLSQLDFVPPDYEWNKKLRMPSIKQYEFIQEKKENLSKRFEIDKDKIVEYCAYYEITKTATGRRKTINRKFNLVKLVRTLFMACDTQDKVILGQQFVETTSLT